jgi:hypothetical protein
MSEIGYCPVCGDYLFDGMHRGHVEIWCRAIRETKNNSAAVETNIAETKTCETNIPVAGETKNRRRGRPCRETITPWAIAGMSRATWYRRQQSSVA